MRRTAGNGPRNRRGRPGDGDRGPRSRVEPHRRVAAPGRGCLRDLLRGKDSGKRPLGRIPGSGRFRVLFHGDRSLRHSRDGRFPGGPLASCRARRGESAPAGAPHSPDPRRPRGSRGEDRRRAGRRCLRHCLPSCGNRGGGPARGRFHAPRERRRASERRISGGGARLRGYRSGVPGACRPLAALPGRGADRHGVDRGSDRGSRTLPKSWRSPV